LKPLLQEVKQALFERDFERAFGRQDYLEAYAFRWSPSRALCYLSIFVDLQDHLTESFLFRSMAHNKRSSADDTSEDKFGPSISDPASHVACLGGGAAEVVAFGGLLKYLIQNPMDVVQDTEESSVTGAMDAMKMSDNPPTKIGVLLVDTAAWGDVIHKLSSTLTTPPPLSKYASATAKASNAPFLPAGVFNPTFQRDNLLAMNKSSLELALGQQPILITLLFTLNELYTASITATTAFLLNLTAATATGTLLLVVDSPGSYSEATIGKDKKKYPMQWLMDRTLLGEQKDGGKRKGDDGGAEWDKLVTDESRWFRMPEELKYPISLENMRYQVHLFRRL
jgi:25S rRNA (uracil2843-N3)-methyltransferase